MPYPSRMAGVELHVRWLIRRDMDEILAIEQSTADPWSEDDYVTTLRERNRIGMVVELVTPGPCRGKIVGVMVYGIAKGYYEFLRLAVHPDWCGVGVASVCVLKLLDRLAKNQKRDRIKAMVPESNLPAQMFLKAHGFIAIKVLRGWEDDGSDAYAMVLRVRAAQPVS